MVHTFGLRMAVSKGGNQDRMTAAQWSYAYQLLYILV